MRKRKIIKEKKIERIVIWYKIDKEEIEKFKIRGQIEIKREEKERDNR